MPDERTFDEIIAEGLAYELVSLERAAARQRAARWEQIARRLLVLGNYGYSTEHLDGRLDETGFLSDEWLAEWYGEPLRDYVLADLREADRAAE